MAKGLQSSVGYRSVGVVDVSKGTLISQLTSIRGENYGYEKPSVVTAREMNSLLRTAHFIGSVAEMAGVTDAIKQGTVTEDSLRQSIYATPDGDTLLQVVATTDDPKLSAKLAQATIDSFLQYVESGDVSESRAAEEFFDGQLQDYGRTLDRAESALQDYVVANPGGPQNERPLAEQIEIQRLQSAVDQAQAQYGAAEQKSQEARLATEQAETEVNQRLRTVDEAKVPKAPEPWARKGVFTAALFTMIGFLISFAAVVLATVLDRSFRSVEDVEQLLGVPVLATVPEERSTRRGRKSSKAAPTVPATNGQPIVAKAQATRRGRDQIAASTPSRATPAPSTLRAQRRCRRADRHLAS